MKIPGFIMEYIHLVSNDAAKKELSELGQQYYRTMDSLSKTQTGNGAKEHKGQLRRRTQYAYVVKARMIAKDCIIDHARFEVICWKHSMKFKIIKPKNVK